MVDLLRRAYRFYIGSFDGLSREIWLLAAITFVNRAGSMVIPFLSLYLTQDMGLSKEQVGWIMSCFGAGSVLGSWLGGRLTDRLGHYAVMSAALLSSGIAFIALQYVKGYVPFCVGVFVLMVLSDAFRPAMFVAIRSLAPPESRTRAVTLVRLAINLGFSMGPAIGGLIIVAWSYGGLFWVDGLTCLGAVALMWAYLPHRQAQEAGQAVPPSMRRSPYRDRIYLFFIVILVLIGIAFLQYFSTIPLFYSEAHHLSEFWIGVILGMNGLLIFLTEMPLIKYCEDRRYDTVNVMIWSAALMALSFAVLNVFPVIAFVWVGMVLVTVGEMLNFPFMNRFANERADHGPPGAYMALFTIGWSVAHIIGHTLGLNLIARYGYTATWYAFTGMLLLAMMMLVLLRRMVAEERAAGMT